MVFLFFLSVFILECIVNGLVVFVMSFLLVLIVNGFGCLNWLRVIFFSCLNLFGGYVVGNKDVL